MHEFPSQSSNLHFNRLAESFQTTPTTLASLPFKFRGTVVIGPLELCCYTVVIRSSSTISLQKPVAINNITLFTIASFFISAVGFPPPFNYHSTYLFSTWFLVSLIVAAPYTLNHWLLLWFRGHTNAYRYLILDYFIIFVCQGTRRQLLPLRSDSFGKPNRHQGPHVMRRLRSGRSHGAALHSKLTLR